MKKATFWIWFLVGLISISINSEVFSQVYNVKDFGAVGNGINDDTDAIQACFKAAIDAKSGSATVFFPEGVFITKKPISAFYTNYLLHVKGSGRSKTTLKNISSESVLQIRGYYSNPSTGQFEIENISLEGQFPAYSIGSAFINKNKWYVGLSVTDMHTVSINNISVQNIYGEGIYISNTNGDKAALNSRFKKVAISNSIVKNCWGLNPKLDDYGDGIYISHVESAYLQNNSIINDLQITNQFGRSGIVIEFKAEDCVIKGNVIQGYDRAMHFEDDFGGHIIEANKISHVDLGLVFFNRKQELNKAVKILDNAFSNKGLKKSFTSLIRTRGIDNISGRSFINFYAVGDVRAGSIIRNNTFVVDGKFQYSSNSIVNIQADDIESSNNTYNVQSGNLLKNPVNYNSYNRSKIVGDRFLNINSVIIRSGSIELLKRNNRFGKNVQLIKY